MDDRYERSYGQGEGCDASGTETRPSVREGVSAGWTLIRYCTFELRDGRYLVAALAVLVFKRAEGVVERISEVVQVHRHGGPGAEETLVVLRVRVGPVSHRSGIRRSKVHDITTRCETGGRFMLERGSGELECWGMVVIARRRRHGHPRRRRTDGGHDMPHRAHRSVSGR
jgi:hypothetical protein